MSSPGPGPGEKRREYEEKADTGKIRQTNINSGPLPPDHIVRFVKKHHVLTLATVGSDGPWCSNVFYAYIPARNVFVFTPSESTRHGRQMLSSQIVAASVVLETRVVGRVQGLQMTGTVEKAANRREEYRSAYLRRFPYAAVADLELWLLSPLEMKLTDNTLGFGKKIAWVAAGPKI